MNLLRQRLIAVLMAAAVGAVLPGHALRAQQTITGFERDRALTMLGLVHDDISKHYFDPAFGGADLAAIFDTAKARIGRATRVEETLLAIAQATLELNDGHTAFLPPSLAVRADYGWTMSMIGDSCRVMTVAPGSDADIQGVHPGDAVLEIERLHPARVNLHTIFYMLNLLSPRRSLHVTLAPPGAAPRELTLLAKIVGHRQTYDISGQSDDIWELIRQGQNEADSLASRYREFGDSVLVWKLHRFDADDHDVDVGLKRARGRQALILDLRGNPGGSVETMLRLLNGLYSDSTMVANVRGREVNKALFVKGSGARAFAGALLVLVDSRSASGSEAVSRVVQLSGRGRILGDRTAGALREALRYIHGAGTQSVALYGTSVTIADFILSDGKSIDGVGVPPDEMVLPSGAEMAAGADPVLARALALAGVTRTAAQAGQLMLEK